MDESRLKFLMDNVTDDVVVGQASLRCLTSLSKNTSLITLDIQESKVHHFVSVLDLTYIIAGCSSHRNYCCNTKEDQGQAQYKGILLYVDQRCGD